MEVDRPEVVADVLAAFERYEAALVANDLAVLDELFWDDGRTVRFGFGETEVGHVAVAAGRRSRPRQSPPRQLRRVEVTTFGLDVGTVNVEFVLDGTGAAGRQSQTWVRFAEGWRVVSAHVSWPA